jgi:hypothetical protein
MTGYSESFLVRLLRLSQNADRFYVGKLEENRREHKTGVNGIRILNFALMKRSRNFAWESIAAGYRPTEALYEHDEMGML